MSLFFRFITTCFLLACIAVNSRADTGPLRIGLSAEVTSIDPHWNNSGPNVAVSAHLFEPLVRTDAQGRLIPGLALSWRNVDPTTWEIALRHGVKFHDGSEMSAEDVIFSLERPASVVGSPAPFTQFVKSIAGKNIVDRYTIRLHTHVPYVLLPYDLNSVFIVSKHAAQGAEHADFDSGRAAVGTGPYKLVRFVRGERIELDRFDQYWGDKPQWQHVSLRLLNNDAARLSALLSGDVDVIENVPTQDIARLRSNPQFRVDQLISWRTIFLQMDQFRDTSPDITDRAGHPLDHNPFKDVRVRRAISKAINRPAIVERVMEGLAVPAANLVSPGIFGHNVALKPDAYDPEEAKHLMSEAGYAEGFAVTLNTPSNRYVNDEKIAQAIASMLSRIGILTRVTAQPWSAYLPKARASAFSFNLIGWGSFLGDNTIRAHLCTPDPAKGYGTWNFGRYSNARIDQLVDQDFQIFDSSEREKSAKSIIALALEDEPVIPLYHQLASWGLRKDLHYPGRVDEFTLAQDITGR